MATLDQVVTQVKTILTTALPQIDQSSTDEYLPPIKTADTALIIPAFGMQTEVNRVTIQGTIYQRRYTIRIEFWVKHLGSNSGLTQRVRTLVKGVDEALAENLTLNSTVGVTGGFAATQFELPVQTVVDDGMIEIGGAAYCRVVTTLRFADLETYTP